MAPVPFDVVNSLNLGMAGIKRVSGVKRESLKRRLDESSSRPFLAPQ